MLAAVVALVLAACSSDLSGEAPQVTGVAAGDAGFVQRMLVNHKQAVALASRALDPTGAAPLPLQMLAHQIQTGDNAEIGQMSRWLRQWQVPTPLVSSTTSLPASGFEQSWLRAMIGNRRAAIAAARQVRRTSQNPQVLDLAAGMERRLREQLRTLRAQRRR